MSFITKPLPIKACIFDMDGLLINTEDLYTEVTNELLARYRKPPLPVEAFLVSKIPKGHGKPAPDIYLVSLQMINDERKSKNLEPLTPEECLVFGNHDSLDLVLPSKLFLEDSIAGVQAGRSAGMRVVWVPDPIMFKHFEKIKDDIIGPNNEIIFSLEDFDPKKYGL
ncbi:hypothetical protein PCANB_000905 [Pneumocystis canis]|nr:hypothetical protein PCANB_000905 [Pneumocystis canis]